MGVRVLIVVRLLFVVFGLVGNLIALSAFCISRRMRLPSNLFVACLTITDLLYLLADIFLITTEFIGYQFYDHAVCTFIGTIMLFLPQLFNDSIVAISVVRYINIVHMANAKVWLTWRRCLIALVILIVHSLVSPIVAWSGWSRLYYADVIQVCTLDWFYDIWATVIGLALNGIVLPNIIILYCYARIYMTYKKSKQRVAAHKEGTGHSDSKVKRELQLTMQIVVIYMVFITTSLLLGGLTLGIEPSLDHHILAELAMMMLTVSTAVNPPVYFYFNKNVRLDLIKYFSKCCCSQCRGKRDGNTSISPATAGSHSQSQSQESAPQAWKSKDKK